jgi:hypothetical protein
LPHALFRKFNFVLAATMLLAAGTTLGASPTPAPAGEQLRLVWRAPAKGTAFIGLSSVQHNIAFQMSEALKAMAGHRADPIYVVEDRTRTYTTPNGEADVYVDDAFARHHGGPNNTDPTGKKRARKQIVPFDQNGRIGYEPYLCKDEPPLNDANPNPTSFSLCSASASDPDARTYEDPGDAVLTQFPAGPAEIGQTWTFTRPVVVGREEGYGPLDYVLTLQRLDQRGKHQIAVFDVSATGRINPSKDLQARGFHTATMTLSGTAEFDVGQGIPGAQHYTGHVEFHASIMGANIGYTFDEVYDGQPWTQASASTQ